MHRGAGSRGLSGQSVAGKTEGDFQTRNHKKGEGSQRGRTSEPRQDGFLGTGGRSPAGWDHSAGLAFTAAIIISDANDRHTDDRYHSCRSMSLRASRQHPMRSDPGRTAWSPCTDEGEVAEGPPMWLSTSKLQSLIPNRLGVCPEGPGLGPKPTTVTWRKLALCKSPFLHPPRFCLPMPHAIICQRLSYCLGGNWLQRWPGPRFRWAAGWDWRGCPLCSRGWWPA